MLLFLSSILIEIKKKEEHNNHGRNMKKRFSFYYLSIILIKVNPDIKLE